MRSSVLALILVTALGAGCGGSSTSSQSGGSSGGGTVVGTASVNGSKVLVDASGHTLYAFTQGVGCSGKCAQAWPPLLAKGSVAAKKGSGVDAGKLGTVKRSNGDLQVAYDGHPLYRFAEDSPGESSGAGMSDFGGTWQVVRVSSGSFGNTQTGPSCNPDCGY